MRRFVAVLMGTAAVLGASAVQAKPAEGPSHVFEARDLFGLELASDTQIRPDGGAVAYVRASYDIMTDRARRAIWLVDASTGENTPLVATAGGAFSPRWSPDGRRLAYVSTVDGAPALYVRWMATGATAKVSNLSEAPGALSWSPDGRRIAFTLFMPDEAASVGPGVAKPEGAKWAEPLKVINRIAYRADDEGDVKPGYSHVFVIDADGGAPRQVTFGAYDDDGPLSWTPDSRAIVFGSNRGKDWERNGNDNEVFRVDADGSGLIQLTDRRGPDQGAVVSPDGSKIAYVGYDDRVVGYQNDQLWIMDRDGKNPRLVSGGLDRSVNVPRWAADGKSVYVQSVDHGMNRVLRVGLDGKLTTVAEGLAGQDLDRPYSGGGFSVAKDGTVAFMMGDSLHPPDVGLARGGQTRRLTHFNTELFAGKQVAEARPLPVTSSFDKRPIDAWMLLPPNYDPAKRYPLILEIHGGPFSSYAPVFASELQLFAAAGYVVVYSNPRGSTSYGEEFANTIDKNYPSQDYDDLISVVDAAIAKGVADPDNLFVTGGSGGGVLTAWIVGKTDRFKAAVVQKPVINWASEVLTTDGYTFMAKYWFGKMPWEDPAAYWKRSPLSLVGNVKTPTMVMVGEEDHRTPASEAEQYYAALQIRGAPTALVKVPGASHHGLAARPSQQAAEANAILGWFARYRTDRR